MARLIVCLVGMPGAGKSTIAEGLKARGCTVVNMGDAVRAEAKRRNIEPTGDNLGRIMLQLRDRDGPGAVAHLVKPLVRDAGSGTVVIDGIRSGREVAVLRECGPLKLLAVHASSGTRFGFLKRRRRSDDPNSLGKLHERDRRELGVGISDPIALADETISNNNLSRDGLVEAAFQIVRGWGG